MSPTEQQQQQQRNHVEFNVPFFNFKANVPEIKFAGHADQTAVIQRQQQQPQQPQKNHVEVNAPFFNFKANVPEIPRPPPIPVPHGVDLNSTESGRAVQGFLSNFGITFQPGAAPPAPAAPAPVGTRQITDGRDS